MPTMSQLSVPTIGSLPYAIMFTLFPAAFLKISSLNFAALSSIDADAGT